MALFDRLTPPPPRLALVPQEQALERARSVVLRLCHMAGVRRVRAMGDPTTKWGTAGQESEAFGT
jgi:hypothetical protein